MKLEVYNTHMELSPYVLGDYPVIEKIYTAEDGFNGEDTPCGYIIENRHLYLPKGTPIGQIEKLTKCKTTFKRFSDPFKEMTRKHYPLFEPRDKLQEESIDFLVSLPDHQLGLNLGVGTGKTFVTGLSTVKLNLKTIIITPNDGLKKQWIKTYKDMLDFKSDELLNISGSAIMDAILNNVEDSSIENINVFFVNHQTLNSFMSSHGNYELHNFFKKIGVGIKVYDESHLNFNNILLIDSFTNTDKTWYLTATFDRSSKSESKCFKQAFSSVIGFGETESKAAVRKHVIYHVVNINSHIDIVNRKKVMGWNGMTAVSYGKYAYIEDPNESAYNTILKILDKIKNVEGKILILVPLIDAVDKVASKLKKDVPDKSIGIYHSKVDKDEKESALSKDIIVSTLKSCGTGRDIKGLRVVINGEPIASKINAEQMIGRLRPYAPDKDTYFFDIVDTCIAPVCWWFKARFKKIKEIVKNVVYLNINE